MSTSNARPTPHELVERHFRHDYARLVAALVRRFGYRHVDRVEDAVQAALGEAVRRWRVASPRNPRAWLRRVAENRLLDGLKSSAERRRADETPLEDWAATDDEAAAEAVDRELDSGLSDGELRLMFACCHPALPEATRIALTLKSLCGFGTAEIARALVWSEENVKKRLTRGKAELLERRIDLELPRPDELTERLASVHRVLYLLFNEGYSSAGAGDLVRPDVCQEAARLAELLLASTVGATPATAALLSLMAFHLARLPARVDAAGAAVLMEDQDRTLWDWSLITRATRLLAAATVGPSPSRYHLEAGVAMLHAHAPSYAATNWEALERNYDALLRLEPSPVTALHRAVVVAERRGPEAGLAAIAAISDLERLESYHLLYAVRGVLHLRAGRRREAAEQFRAARERTRTPAELTLLDRRSADCGED